jgi:hypothetical protein
MASTIYIYLVFVSFHFCGTRLRVLVSRHGDESHLYLYFMDQKEARAEGVYFDHQSYKYFLPNANNAGFIPSGIRRARPLSASRNHANLGGDRLGLLITARRMS